MYRKQILKGIDFLVHVQNPDGGIPGMEITGTSACWTTAEALEAVLLSPYLKLSYYPFVNKMINFLLDTQIKEGADEGAWPEYISTQNVQTVATGHALAALKLSEMIVVDNQVLLNKIKNAIKLGFNYLNSKQNHDGGWGIRPGEGKGESRAFSTFFVLRGYIENGYDSQNSKIVREACNYLMSLKDAKTGGFKQEKDTAPDTCYTARIISVLLRAKFYNTSDAVIKNAVKFIFQDKTLKSLFAIKHESYVSDKSAGMVIFHSNTPVDVMEALCLCNIFDRRVIKLGQWIVDTQEDNGGWYLGGTRDPEINEGVITWTTNEGIYALSCCVKAFSENYTEKLKKQATFRLKALLVLVAIILGMYFNPDLIKNNNILNGLWQKVPTNIQSFLLITVLVGTILNLFSNFLYDVFKKARKEDKD